MKYSSKKIFCGFIVFIIFLPSIIYAANYPLQIVRPKAGIGVNDRIYIAYPGLEYRVRVAVFGGLYPFKYALTNQPSGMNINENTGEITWTNPQSNSGEITLTVTDAEGTSTFSTWEIAVSTSRFHFVDASVSDGGDGSLGNPWNDWDDFYLGSSDTTYDNDIIYFKNGTYVFPLEHSSGTIGSANAISINEHPKIFLAYPENNAVYFDGDKATDRVILRSSRNNIYFDNIHFINGYGYFFVGTVTLDYLCFIDCSFADIEGSGSSSNQAAICFRDDALNDQGVQGNVPLEDDSRYKLYPVVQNCSFENFVLDENGIGHYGVRYGVYSENTFNNLNSGSAVRLKSTSDKITIRHNVFSDTGKACITIPAQYYACNADISFNYINYPNTAIEVGSYTGANLLGETHIYRNTFVGGVYLSGIYDDDGPVYFSNNVIVNTSPADHIRDEIEEHWSINANKSVLSDNLMGTPTDNIVDSSGNLIGTYRDQYLGTRGWESVSNESPIEDKINPIINIESPPENPVNTTQSTITISGQVSDNVGIQSVKWALNGNAPVNATGLNNWSASIPLVEGENNIVFTATDTSENPATASKQVNYTISEGTHTITFGDTPDTDYGGTVVDTCININDNINVNNVTLNTYTWQTNQPANAILMKWDLSAIPAEAQIESAKLYLYMSEAGGDTEYDISVHNIINHNPDLSQCTGFTYDGTNNWTSNNQCYNNIPLAQADIADTEDVKPINTTSGYKTWDIANMARAWLANPEANFGLLLNSDSIASASSNRVFSSSEALDPNQRPKLEITYTTSGSNPPPAVPAPTGLVVISAE